VQACGTFFFLNFQPPSALFKLFDFGLLFCRLFALADSNMEANQEKSREFYYPNCSSGVIL
jgi:hypothetical protein